MHRWRVHESRTERGHQSNVGMRRIEEDAADSPPLKVGTRLSALREDQGSRASRTTGYPPVLLDPIATR